MFVGQYPTDYYHNYLNKNLPNILNKRINKSARNIKINGYDIHIEKYPCDRFRGYRPELIYYIGFPPYEEVVKQFKDVDNYIRFKKSIEWDTKYQSTRKESIRCINEAEEIDLRELIDDDYSLLQCEFKKLELKDKLKYIWLKIRNKFRKEK